MNNPKRLVILFGVTLLLQILYYLLFMHQDFVNGNYYFNPISVVSVLSLLIYYFYLKKPSVSFKQFDILYHLKWFLLAFLVLNSFLVLGSLLGNLFFNIFYFFFTSQAISSYNQAFPTVVWHYNLGQLTLMMMALFIFMYLKSKSTNKEELTAKLIYKLSVLVILVVLLVGFFTRLDILFYHSFTVMAFLIFWFFTPIFYMIVKHFHADLSILLAWGISILIYWPLIIALFDNLVHIYGYFLE
jgi:hypothetical protein